jgi:hypothetical protein
LRLLLVAVVALFLVGCYNREMRTKERLDEKVEAFTVANQRAPLPAEYAALKAEAAKEEDAERKSEMDKAKQDAISGATGIATGNYIAGGFLLLGALGTWLGLNRGKKVAPAPAPPPGGTV